MKKIVFLALGAMLWSCGNSGNVSNSYSISPEQRESFTENNKVKNDIFFSEEKRIAYIKENEYNTLEEAFKKAYKPHIAEDIINTHKSKIEEIENLTKSKFYLFKDGYQRYIYFTPIDTNELKGGVVKAFFKSSKLVLAPTDIILIPYIPNS